jgi:hypothetical protein
MFFSLSVEFLRIFDLVGQEIIRFVTNKVRGGQRCAYVMDYDERIAI